MKKAFYIEIKQDGITRHFVGANLPNRPVLFANEASAQPQVNFLLGDYNKAMKEIGKPLIQDAKIEGIDYYTYEKGIANGLSFADALESAKATYDSRTLRVKGYDRGVL